MTVLSKFLIDLSLLSVRLAAATAKGAVVANLQFGVLNLMLLAISLT